MGTEGQPYPWYVPFTPLVDNWRLRPAVSGAFAVLPDDARAAYDAARMQPNAATAVGLYDIAAAHKTEHLASMDQRRQVAALGGVAQFWIRGVMMQATSLEPACAQDAEEFVGNAFSALAFNSESAEVPVLRGTGQRTAYNVGHHLYAALRLSTEPDKVSGVLLAADLITSGMRQTLSTEDDKLVGASETIGRGTGRLVMAIGEIVDNVVLDEGRLLAGKLFAGKQLLADLAAAPNDIAPPFRRRTYASAALSSWGESVTQNDLDDLHREAVARATRNFGEAEGRLESDWQRRIFARLRHQAEQAAPPGPYTPAQIKAAFSVGR